MPASAFLASGVGFFVSASGFFAPDPLAVSPAGCFGVSALPHDSRHFESADGSAWATLTSAGLGGVAGSTGFGVVAIAAGGIGVVAAGAGGSGAVMVAGGSIDGVPLAVGGSEVVVAATALGS